MIKNKLLKIASISILSVGFISATTVGIVKLTKYYTSKENAKTNPIITLSARDSEGKEGEFIIEGVSSVSTSRYIKYGTTWATFKNNMPIPTKSGFDIQGWQYQSGDNWYALEDNYSFTENVTIRVSKWSGAAPSHFATDSWQTIVDVASEGLDKLKYVYSLDIADNNNSFIGKTRDVYIKGIGNFKVRVIGEDQDIIANENNKVAALTFEFVDIVYPALGYDSNYNSWSESDLYRFLNDQFIYRLPEPINNPNVLQKVMKNSYEYDANTGNYALVNKSQDIFLPSLSELGFNFVNEDNVNHKVNLENNTYTYYRYDSNNKAKVLPEYKKKSYTDSNTGVTTDLPYWTRSAYIDNGAAYTKGTHAHAIDANGYICDSLDSSVNIAKGIAPCFAIGKDTAYTLTVNTNNKFNYVANKNIVKNNATVIDLTDKDITDTSILPLNATDYIEVKVGNKVLPETEEISAGKFKTHYTYDKTNHRLTINSDSITDNVTVTIKPYESTFYNDTWSTFLTNANKGYDNLAKVTTLGESGVYIDDYNANGGTFVGLNRFVKVGDENHLVRVIGEKHDITSDSKTTTLTFEFVEGISESYFSGQNNNNYCTSGSDSILKNNIEGLITSFPSELQATTGTIGMRSCSKKVNIDEAGSGTYTSHTFSTQLFPLSISEISNDTTYVPSGIEEGTIYDYYKNNSYFERIKYAPTYMNYWLRSPSNVSSTSVIAISLQYGLVDGNTHVKDYASIAPAFAVGIES